MARAQKARTDDICADTARAESRGGAAASKLVQQADEDVDSFRETCVFVSSSSQKLGVNLLVGFEGYIFFYVIAGLTKQNKTKK